MENKSLKLPSKEDLMPNDFVCDENGKVIAEIKIDLQNNRIHSIETPPYENSEQLSENNDEIICVINDDGKINTEIKSTRKISREKNLRYLVVSTIIMHNREMLFQKRSENKKIDPGKLSISAHGVAKQLYSSSGLPWKNIANISLVNSALEINEELRHGLDSIPFNIVFWYKGKDALKRYVAKEKINDSNKIFLLPEVLDTNNNYPINNTKENDENKKRARSLSIGYIFSSENPAIFIDPSEVDSVIWKNSTEIEEEFLKGKLNKDSKELIDNILTVTNNEKQLKSGIRKMLFDSIRKR